LFDLIWTGSGFRERVADAVKIVEESAIVGKHIIEFRLPVGLIITNVLDFLPQLRSARPFQGYSGYSIFRAVLAYNGGAVSCSLQQALFVLKKRINHLLIFVNKFS
jgi:hypothetical protein